MPPAAPVTVSTVPRRNWRIVSARIAASSLTVLLAAPNISQKCDSVKILLGAAVNTCVMTASRSLRLYLSMAAPSLKALQTTIIHQKSEQCKHNSVKMFVRSCDEVAKPCN